MNVNKRLRRDKLAIIHRNGRKDGYYGRMRRFLTDTEMQGQYDDGHEQGRQMRERFESR